MIIKILLVSGLLGFGFLLFRGKASASRLAARRLVGALVLVLGVVAILWPGMVTALANLVGVGRGTDLVLYALVIAFLFVCVAVNQRISLLEARYTELARRMAIDQATRDFRPTEALRGHSSPDAGLDTDPDARSLVDAPDSPR